MTKDPGYSDEDLAAVSDNPEWTVEEFARSKPFHVRFPELAASLYGYDPTAPGTDAVYVPVAIERDLVEKIKAGGPGWEARLNDMLRRAIGHLA